MKKIFLLLLLLVAALLLLCSCGGKQEAVSIDYGESELYTTKDMDAAIQVIQETFATFDGCTLHSLTYGGDAACVENLESCQTLSKAGEIEQCIVFNSSFHSPKEGGGAWEADTEYTWTWYLGRETTGRWVLLTYGYA